MIGKLIRIIIFVKDVREEAEFYRDIIGLKIAGEINAEWTELKCGGCNIALHKSNQTSGKIIDSNTKIVFGTSNVSKAKSLIEKRGHKMGNIITFGEIEFCDGRDPEGNVFQISNRGLISLEK